jgi:HTH-type transcriptional regulator, transcriptional repressor of NAD biosynthesis genes
MVNYGLVFGKFMPIHNGHLALIQFAKMHCKELIISMSYTLNDPIDRLIRFEWLKQIFENNKQVKLEMHLDDFQDENMELFESTKLWAKFINDKFPRIEAFFCSELYGEPLSFHLNLPCYFFDMDRNKIPISATAIRNNPFKNWLHIPSVVKPYFVKKICLYGPECVGKTSLSKKLAEIFETEYVHEVARDFLIDNENIDERILIEIASKQIELVKNKIKNSNKFLFCDTDAITTQIYAQHYLGNVSQNLKEIENEIKYDFYFLLDIDLEWEYDPLRDLGERRPEMFSIFRENLEKRGIGYEIISGTWNERLEKIKSRVKTMYLI